MITDKLLYIPDVAQMLNKSSASLRYMITQGDCPPHAKIGGRIMFKQSDVEAWIQEQFDKAAS